MKDSTKVKFVDWIKKIIKYPVIPIQPIQSETRKIHDVNWEGEGPVAELSVLKDIIAMEMGRYLMNNHMIKYSCTSNPSRHVSRPDTTILKGTISVIIK